MLVTLGVLLALALRLLPRPVPAARAGTVQAPEHSSTNTRTVSKAFLGNSKI